MVKDRLINEIVKIANDYKRDEGFNFNFKHVSKWISQFEEKDQILILSELKYILKKSYFSKEKIRKYGEKILKYLKEKSVDYKIKILNVQTKGKSQEELISLFNLESYFEVVNEIKDDNSLYIYLDDGIYSGNKTKYDLKDEMENKLLSGTKLEIIHLWVYLQGVKYIKKVFGDNKKINLNNVTFCSITIYNNIKDCYNSLDILWPLEPENSIEDCYIKKVKETLKTGGYTLHYLFRNKSEFVHEEKMFTCKENRDIIESIFLKYGINIIKQATNPSPSIRPMGFDKLEGMGFGAMIVNYRNIANNCPLVLWYGNIEKKGDVLDCWYPLFPREINDKNIIELIKIMAEVYF